jgi:processive 1,2-diacylglycerol beta-glucosyltransferase
MGKKILLMYITNNSGHHRASLAIESALKNLNTGAEVLTINAVNYTNPVLEKVINKTYMGIIKTRPEVWDYLYDNPSVLRSTQKMRDFIHRYNSRKLRELLYEYKPDTVVCTQAFPCGMVADFKRTHNYECRLFGVLTDYAPHSYWIYDSVDGYIVPSEDTGKRLVGNGIRADRIHVFGIPIDSKFTGSPNRADVFKKHNLDPKLPTLLLMGGGQGLGPLKNLVAGLENLDIPFQTVVVTGTNAKLYTYFQQSERQRKKKTIYFSYADNIDELMEISSLILTKPGGITTAEALSKGLPILIVNPLPGQESMNTRYLLMENVALRARDWREAVVLVEALLAHPTKLAQMSEHARRCAKPDSARRAAELITSEQA